MNDFLAFSNGAKAAMAGSSQYVPSMQKNGCTH